MASREGHDGDDMPRIMMRELHSKENARFLRRMPAFRLPEGLPRRLTSLLDDLDRVEHGHPASRGPGAYGAAGAQQR